MLRRIGAVRVVFIGAVVGIAVLAGGHWIQSITSDLTTPARLAARGERVPLTIKARPTPVAIASIIKWKGVVSERQAMMGLCVSLPVWHPPSVPSLIHFLKLWGKDAELGVSDWSGKRMVETLLDDKLCRNRTVHLGASYLVDSPFGVHVVQIGTRDAKEARGEAHYGQLLKALGQAGVPADHPVTSASGRKYTIHDLFQDEVLRFRWTEELDFIACALAHYLPPRSSWSDKFGNVFTFDELIVHLIEREHGKGSCGGCHQPYAVVTILRADEQQPILSRFVRERALAWLNGLSARLNEVEIEGGGWDTNWAPAAAADLTVREDLLDKVMITGHHLEWLALASPPLAVKKEVVARAVDALSKHIEVILRDEKRSFKTAFPCSHAARALCLLRGEDPSSAFAKGLKEGVLDVRKTSDSL